MERVKPSIKTDDVDFAVTINACSITYTLSIYFNGFYKLYGKLRQTKSINEIYITFFAKIIHSLM